MSVTIDIQPTYGGGDDGHQHFYRFVGLRGEMEVKKCSCGDTIERKVL